MIGVTHGVRLLYPIEGGSPRPVPGLESGEEPIQWSPDGRALYVHHPSVMPNRVWLLDLETGRRRLWKEIPSSEPGIDRIESLLMTSDGESYVYQIVKTFSELYVVDGLK